MRVRHSSPWLQRLKPTLLDMKIRYTIGPWTRTLPREIEMGLFHILIFIYGVWAGLFDQFWLCMERQELSTSQG